MKKQTPFIGYHASHEQFSPSELLRFAQLAERSGFDALNCSDHFHPWSERQGQSGFAFAWLGAAMQTISLPCGVVCSPGQRYHPAIVAQAIATLAEMFPGRFWISLGSGEALNERITGEKWPAKAERDARLLECVAVIRKLLAGEVVSHHGLITIEEARLYTLPSIKPLLMGAAVSDKTAEWIGSWADGLITINKPIDELKKTVNAFRRGGGDGKPMYLKVQLSYANSYDDALQGAYDQWRTNVLAATVLSELWTVKQFDAVGEMVKPDQLHGIVNISANVEEHTAWIQQYVELGFDKIFLHNVNRNQEGFLTVFGQKVLPKVIRNRK